ncbi:MAG TPA: diaminopimelate epimerase [Acidobacteriota bacterium]|nr:diaminopimelate epimerase [Acidobacteriota bacterium]
MIVSAFKYHCYGNDFLVVPDSTVNTAVRPRLAREACHRKTGVGADGVIFLSTGPEAAIEILNRDGSSAGMSGNGLRCAAAQLVHQGEVSGQTVAVETPAGMRTLWLLEVGKGKWTFETDMGEPRFRSEEIPFQSTPPVPLVKDYALNADFGSLTITALNVGNPQCVVFVDRLPDNEELARLGSALERHPAFPEGSNVSFARVEGPGHLRIRIWERGVGPTESSGTGSCGAAVAAIWTGRAHTPVSVESDSGSQQVAWASGEPIKLVGDAELVGEIDYFWNV